MRKSSESVLLAIALIALACLVFSLKDRFKTRIWPPQAIEMEGRPYAITLKGQWLAVSVSYEKYQQSSEHGFVVYKIHNAQVTEMTKGIGDVAWLEGDELYLTRGESLYILNLQTNEDRLEKEKIATSALVTSKHIIWRQNEPEICRYEVDSCAESMGYGCGSGIVVYDQATKEQYLWGVLKLGVSPVELTPSLLVMSERMSGCDIKYYEGPIQIIDLDTREYRIIGPGSVSPGPFTRVTGAEERTVVYTDDYHLTRVLRIEPHQTVQTLVDVEGIEGLGLAGADILLYAKEIPKVYGRSTGLYALNMLTHEQQELIAEGAVKNATGDADHVAWITQSGMLYIASLNLKAPSSPTTFDSPLSTLPPRYQSPLPKPSPPTAWYTPTPPH